MLIVFYNLQDAVYIPATLIGSWTYKAVVFPLDGLCFH